MEDVIIPSEFKVGYNKRSGTFTGKLGYMIYANKSDGSFGQQVSFDQWIDEKMGVDTVKNDYVQGFVLNKGQLNHYRFGASAKFRVFHPHGFEFEISLENLSMLLAYTNIISSEINLPCRIGWLGKNCVLIPKVDLKNEFNIIEKNIHEIFEKAEQKIEKRKGKPLLANALTEGKIVEDINGKRYLVSKKTVKNQKDIVVILVEKSNPVDGLYSMNNQLAFNSASKYFLPLFKHNSEKLMKDDVKKFVNFVEEINLTDSEREFLNHYKVALNICFSEKMQLGNLKDIEQFKNLFLLGDKNKHKNRYMYGIYDYTYTYGSCVKINNIIYLLTTYNSVYSDLNYPHEGVHTSYINEDINDAIISKKGIYLFPLVNVENGNLEKKFHRFYVVGKGSVYNDSFNMSEKEWGKMFELFKNKVEPLTEEDLNFVNERLLIRPEI